MIDGAPMLADLAIGAMETIPLQSSEALLPEDLNVSFKLLPAIIVIGMMGLFIVAGFMFQVADTDDMWVAGRSIGNIENRMAIGANWMSAATYLGVAATVAISGVYGLAYVIGWTTGYFILLIFYGRPDAAVREVYRAGLRRRPLQLRRRAPSRRSPRS